MIKEEQFVIVFGEPKVSERAHISILNGGEYIVESVERLTLYKIRQARANETILADQHLGISDDDIRLINVSGDLRSRGLDLAIRHMRMGKGRRT